MHGCIRPTPLLYLLAEEIYSMFTKREHSYLVTDFIWGQDNTACICWYLLPLDDGFVTFLTHKKCFIIAELAACERAQRNPIIIQNSSNPSS